MPTNYRILALVIVLSGCSSVKIVPAGKDTYMVQRSATTYATAGGLLAQFYEEGSAHCQKQGKSFQPVTQSIVDGIPYVRRGAGYMTFRCLNEADTDLNRPVMEKSPDIVIENRQITPSNH